jgi:RNA polymerase sigma factor (TIGR02999 family)
MAGDSSPKSTIVVQTLTEFLNPYSQGFMTAPPSSEITGLLVDWSNGDQTALERLLPLVERELHGLAHRYMLGENQNHTLQTTALVNEAYLKLVDQNKTHWQNRAHFFAIAATIMRRILLNYARDRRREKRGGKAIQVSLSEAAVVFLEQTEELIALDEALQRLAVLHERKSRVVELRYFGGLDVAETAEVLKVSQVTVMRDWSFARAWLLREIKNER